MDPEDEYGYDDDYADVADEYNNGDDGQTAISYQPVPELKAQKSIVFVTTDEIKTLINEKCIEVEEVYGFSRDECLLINHHFKWRKDLLDNEWFSKEANIRLAAGLTPNNKAVTPPKTEKIDCPMCFETKPRSEFEILTCGHHICKSCFSDYVNFNIKRPENHFYWKCPTAGCNIVIPDSLNQKYTDSKDLPLYYKKMAIAYAENSKSLRWCPGTDCQYACNVDSIAARTVNCPCGYVYCFKCGIDDHQPCNCEAAREWQKKDQSGGANAKWLLAYTKDCPKCKKAIEKNQGCNYMKCRHPGCGQEFCWLCLADWKTHNDHFKCNKYDNLTADQKKEMDDGNQKERQELQKYAFYYERYLNNDVAIKSIDKILKSLKAEQKDVAITLMLSLTQMEFLIEACLVLRSSKRILKWSYAYGFYLANDLQRNLYEIIQENLDKYSSELHVLLEKKYLESKNNIGDFTKFKDLVLASVYKCEQSSKVFLERMEEFENSTIEEQLKKQPELKAEKSSDSDKGKKKDTKAGSNKKGGLLGKLF